MKKILILVILSAAIVTGGYFWSHKSANVKIETPQWFTVQIKKGSIRDTVSCTGQVISNLDVEIKCKASGEIVKLPFDISDQVNKGDLLVELDPVDEQRKVKQAKISLASSQARLMQRKVNLKIAQKDLIIARKSAAAALKSAEAYAKNARAKAERMRKLFEKKLTSQEEKDTGETTAIQAEVDLENARIQMEQLANKARELEIKRQDVWLAKGQMEMDKINLSLAEQRLKDTRVFSPIDGVVSERNVQSGQIISSGINNVGGGTRVMVLSDLSRLFILASVDESYIGKVELGQKVIITADAFPGKRFFGKIDRIATKGINVSNVVTFEVKIEVRERNRSLLKPEMTANVEIIVAEKEEVLMVPSEAVLYKKGGHFVRVKKDDGSIEERPVQAGISNGVVIEIIKGLSQGDTIIYRKGEARSRWRTEQSRRSLSSSRGMRMMLGGGVHR
jgi:HlyD family secretion protein